MKFEVIDVQCYAGYKSNEKPTSFRFRGRDFQIVEVLDRWYEGSPDANMPYLNYFKVKAADGQEYILRYNGLFDKWSIASTP